MADENILLVLSDPKNGQELERRVLAPAGYRVTLVTERQAAENLLRSALPDLIILSDRLENKDSTSFADLLFERYPLVPVILLAANSNESKAISTFRQGFFDYLYPPMRGENVLQVIKQALQRMQRMKNWARLEARRNTQSLERKVNGLETLQRVSRQVTSSLDLDSVLQAVVEAAVELTCAEEGSLLLLDESSGELYMRAGRNFQEDFVRTFRLPAQDSLAGQVLRTGKPLLIDEKTPKKIKTSYLVYTLVYVPLIIQGRVIGVLEVDNRQSRKSFTDYHVTLVSALADYATIAVENARLFSRTEIERNKLETILTSLAEGVIVINLEGRIMLINPIARAAFSLENENLTGKRIQEVLHHPELLEVLNEENRLTPCQMEISLDEGRVLNAQITPIPEVGLAVTMQDITHLKELDRIKSDFVSTVSHDLRSPLTAILGYVELIDRVGPITEQQKEFIRRVQFSVHNITSLINDLLDLGRIEAGFDASKEITPLSAIIRYAVEGLKSRMAEKNQQLIVDIQDDLPQVLGNPVRLRQMVSNLAGNAVKYTPAGGRIAIHAHTEGDQIILQVSDNGQGIPPADQPYIFDKFYRANNIPGDIPGTGLGLAIVKSIVENHQGRIWVDSSLGEGSTFTVVLPVTNQQL